jgi:GT2 family glycosyltransferase
VLVIDVERPPPEVSALHPDGGRYAAAWLLLRRDGQPMNLLKVPFGSDRDALSHEQLAAHIELASADAPTGARSAVSQGPPRQPMISVVVPSKLERRETLSRCIESLEALDYPSYELLLVDNRARDEDGSLAWLERFPSVRVLRERRPGVSVARNRGLEAAAGEIVAYIDDDVSVDPGWLRAIAARFAARPEEACVTGLILPAELETPAELRLERYYDGDGVAPRIFQPVSHRLEHQARGRGIIRRTSVGAFDAEDRLLRTFSIYAAGRFGTGANMAFRTTVLRDIGGLDVRLGTGMPATGGDLHVFIRLLWNGHSLGFEPAALVNHTHFRDELSLQKQIEANGVGSTALICALIEEDPRHILAMLATLPQAARSPYVKTLRTRFLRGTSPAPDTPAGPDAEDQSAMSRLTRTELRGMARGPAAYWRSRRLVRKW